jgi:hypothetical protein
VVENVSQSPWPGDVFAWIPFFVSHDLTAFALLGLGCMYFLTCRK